LSSRSRKTRRPAPGGIPSGLGRHAPIQISLAKVEAPDPTRVAGRQAGRKKAGRLRPIPRADPDLMADERERQPARRNKASRTNRIAAFRASRSALCRSSFVVWSGRSFHSSCLPCRAVRMPARAKASAGACALRALQSAAPHGRSGRSLLSDAHDVLARLTPLRLQCVEGGRRTGSARRALQRQGELDRQDEKHNRPPQKRFGYGGYTEETTARRVFSDCLRVSVPPWHSFFRSSHSCPSGCC
jgi:hypothetical protein